MNEMKIEIALIM